MGRLPHPGGAGGPPGAVAVLPRRPGDLPALAGPDRGRYSSPEATLKPRSKINLPCCVNGCQEATTSCVTTVRAWSSRPATAVASGVDDTYCHRNSSGDGSWSVLPWARASNRRKPAPAMRPRSSSGSWSEKTTCTNAATSGVRCAARASSRMAKISGAGPGTSTSVRPDGARTRRISRNAPRAVGEELQSELAQHKVEGSVGERERVGGCLVPGDRRTAGQRGPSDRQHPGVDVDTGDRALGPGTLGSHPGHDSRPAGDVQYPLAGPDPGDVDQSVGQWPADRGNEVPLVVFGRDARIRLEGRH